MDVAQASDRSFAKGDVGRFAGEVWLTTTLRNDQATNIGIVHFSPGARTHWHHHPSGQFLYGVSGRGRVRSQGETGRLLEAGDVVHVDAGEWHFHGADIDAPMVHLAVNGGGDAVWGAPVTDEEYAEGF